MTDAGGPDRAQQVGPAGAKGPGGRFVGTWLWFELPDQSQPGRWVRDVWVGIDYRYVACHGGYHSVVVEQWFERNIINCFTMMTIMNHRDRVESLRLR